MSQEREYTVIDAAKKLGVNPETIRRAIRSGQLTANKDWMKYTITETELERFRVEREKGKG